jgi:DNA-binding GntR family transcriptional regulator
VFSPVSSQKKADVAYVELRHHILDGSLAPGAMLNQEQAAAELRISVTPLREALRRLEGEGLVLMVGNHVSIVPLSNKEIWDLRQVRGSLEIMSVKLAVANITPDQKTELILLSDISPDLGVAEWHESHMHFHRRIWEIAANYALMDTLDRIMARIERYYRRLAATADYYTQITAIPHREVAESLASGEEEIAIAAMEEHLRPVLVLGPD